MARPQPRAVPAAFGKNPSGPHPDLGPEAGGGCGRSGAASLLRSRPGTTTASLLPPRQRRAPLPRSRGAPRSPTGPTAFTCRALIARPSATRKAGRSICAAGGLAWARFGTRAQPTRGPRTHRCGISSPQPLAQAFSLSFPCYPLSRLRCLLPEH